MQVLDNTDEIFEVFYNISVGLERLLKIAVVLVEHNDERYRNYIRKIVMKISGVLYNVVKTSAYDLNLYTYELRHGSRAETIFLGQSDLPSEDVLWKELLIFFMNTKSSSGLLKFLRT